MRVELKEFQRDTVEALLRKLSMARRDIGEDGGAQAIGFSAPTAAGKTVMAAALIESVLYGGAHADATGFIPDPDTVFLWLSDRPDLNEQSRLRLLRSSELLKQDRMVVVDSKFDQEAFSPGHVYFLNFQKLSRDALLVRRGDERQWTIWETIANTERAAPGRLAAIIDEAHRGVTQSRAERAEFQTIPQRFLSGGGTAVQVRDIDGNLHPFPPVNLVIGISATPARFDSYLTHAGNRTIRREIVLPARVRESGLIKDSIFVDTPGTRGNPTTMLELACEKLREMEGAWASYTHASDLPAIVPALIVQVENSPGEDSETAAAATASRARARPTRTDIQEVVSVISRSLPGVTSDQFVHCFSGFGDIQLSSGAAIRWVEPNSVSDDPSIRVVLFKSALNTGWDCPRAEVMMSFRGASDPTAIAQLVGRMIRTPLAKRIDDDERLNAAHLFLPFYNQDELNAVVAHLTSDDAETTTKVIKRGETVTLSVQPVLKDVVTALRGLPTFTVPSNRPIPEPQRLIKLARLITLSGIEPTAHREAIDKLVDVLIGDLAARRSEVSTRIAGADRLPLTTYVITDGEVKVGSVREARLTQEDIDRQFSRAGRFIDPEVAQAYIKRRFAEAVALKQAKLEYLELTSQPHVLSAVQTAAEGELGQLQRAHHRAISQLPPEGRQKADDILRAGRTAQLGLLNIPDTIVVPAAKEGATYRDHLFLDQGGLGSFESVLNTWEKAVLAEEQSDPGFVTWLRNFDRKTWALAYVYEHAGTPKPGFPDFLIVRKDGGGYAFDLMEPHQGEDSVAKLLGLAKFVEGNPTAFGRVQMIRLDGGNLVRLKLEDRAVRSRVLRQVRSHDDMMAVFSMAS